jgi:hypothetical protein
MVTARIWQNTHMISISVPLWTAALFAALFWLIQFLLRHHVRLWAALCLPATLLHELAHGVVGLVLMAQPTQFNLWPKRVSQSAWRLGYVGFNRLRWWNAGAVGLAPLLWVLALIALRFEWQYTPKTIGLGQSALIGAALVWTWLAVAPSKSDWTLALKNPFSSLVFVGLWLAAVDKLLALGFVFK